MTSRERLLTAINHKTPDRVPLDIGGSFATGINSRAYRNLKDHLEIDTRTQIASQRSDVARVEDVVRVSLGIDTYPLLPGAPDGSVVQFDNGSYRDEWGVVRNRAEGGHYYVTRPPLAMATISDLASYSWPDPDDPGWVRGLAEEAKRIRSETDYALVLSLPVGFGHQSQFLRGYDNWLMDCVSDTRFAEALMDRVLEIHTQVVERLLAEVGKLADVVLYADDVGFQDRPIMSPPMFHRIMAPRQKRYLEFVRARTDANILYHTCGSVYSLIPDFIDAGVDVLNPIQTRAAGMEPARLKREFGRDLAFWGGVDMQRLLPYGSPEEVSREVEELVNVLGAGGGYVVCAANNIQADTPPPNIMALARACQKAHD
jgi:uroporphyrinogen decarboxylase